MNWALGMGHWAWGIGHGALAKQGNGALGMGHWALGMGHWALGMGHGALGIGHWAILPLSPSPFLPLSPSLTNCSKLAWKPRLEPIAIPQSGIGKVKLASCKASAKTGKIKLIKSAGFVPTKAKSRGSSSKKG